MRHLLLRVALAAIISPLFGVAPAFVAASAARPQPPEASAALPETTPGVVVAVGGFRSARWGMSETEVKAAIQRDFGIPPAKVAAAENAAERTNVLSVSVGNLIEGAGTARVSYIFGYKTRKLIQVTILWGTPVDPQVPPENIVTAANQLRQLFLDSGYEPKTIIANSRLADGSVLVFEGEDGQQHMTVLRLATTPSPAKGAHDKTGVGSIVLSLSYVLDGRNPDIFRLKKGQF
jgi:hypothetical protein